MAKCSVDAVGNPREQRSLTLPRGSRNVVVAVCSAGCVTVAGDELSCEEPLHVGHVKAGLTHAIKLYGTIRGVALKLALEHTAISFEKGDVAFGIPPIIFDLPQYIVLAEVLLQKRPVVDGLDHVVQCRADHELCLDIFALCPVKSH